MVDLTIGLRAGQPSGFMNGLRMNLFVTHQ